jgi:hypothetical protein
VAEAAEKAPPGKESPAPKPQAAKAASAASQTSLPNAAPAQTPSAATITSNAVSAKKGKDHPALKVTVAPKAGAATKATAAAGVAATATPLVPVASMEAPILDAGSSPAPKQTPDKRKVLHAFVARKKDGSPAKTFLSGAKKIYGIWKGEGLRAGDVVHAVWISEAWEPGSKDVTITEADVVAYKPDDDGIFSLLRPEGGWPIGHYRLEFYVRGRLVDTVRFSVDEDVTVQVR